jgi:hypothetical protein
VLYSEEEYSGSDEEREDENVNKIYQSRRSLDHEEGCKPRKKLH